MKNEIMDIVDVNVADCKCGFQWGKFPVAMAGNFIGGIAFIFWSIHLENIWL